MQMTHAKMEVFWEDLRSLAQNEVYPEELHTVLNMVAVLAGNSEQGANEPLVICEAGLFDQLSSRITEFLVVERAPL